MYSDLVISLADRRPMYLQIIEQIRQRIAVGDWQPGAELPSIRALAASLQVSVITVKRSYLELERDGVIVTRQGKGSFVADRADLSTQLRRDELDERLAAAADLGYRLGMTGEAIAARLVVAVNKVAVNKRRDEDRQKTDESEP
jgi:GntR family transcriptional regulator